MPKPLLSVKDLKVKFYSNAHPTWAVNGVSFELEAGASLGIVGESGSGKSVTGLAIIGLIPEPPGKVTGQIVFQGLNLRKMNESQLETIRGNDISMIFQEPMTSLNPVFTIGNQIMETLMLHQKLTRRQARAKTIEILELVGISSPEKRINEYPHQLSGGMLQRVMIAMAFSCGPKLLIADEPTTALDVTIQAQILDLMKGLQRQLGTAIILISHDLGVIAEVAEDVAVMYGGRIVECGSAIDIYRESQHPYTEGLLRSMPSITSNQKRLQAIPGTVPAPGEILIGCDFYPRCPYGKPICKAKKPMSFLVGPGHFVACWRVVNYQKPKKEGEET